jgi:hypothetical protein
MEALGFSLALSAQRDHVLSARPDAPVVPERPPRARAHAGGGTRRVAAGVLRRLADRLEPCPQPLSAR